MLPPPSKEGILILGEIIRLKMHRDPTIVKDRKYRLRNYPCCFVGKEVVEWLLKNHEAQSASNAIACMKVLQSNGIFHHVCDDHLFKNEYLFYRFRIDDGTFFVDDAQYERFHEAIMVHQRILGDSNNRLMKNVHLDSETTLENCFVAHQFISWMVSNNIACDRSNGVDIGKQFLDILVIKPVLVGECEFEDDETVYHFIFDIAAPLPLHKALNLNDEDGIMKGIDDYMKRINLDAEANKKYLQMLWRGGDDGFVEEEKDVKPDVNSNDVEQIPKLKPVILRDVTAKELMSKDSPYQWKNVRITSDKVGFGFVIRGDGPCYVQAIDPTGPAAVAGLKVRMYIYSVNGKIVLAMNHDEIANIILQGMVVDLVALQHVRSSGT